MKKQEDNVLKNLLCQGVEKGVFPGAAAGLFRAGKRLTAVAGYTRLDAKKLPVREDSFFDIASLTKPLATALLTFILIREGRLTLDDRVDCSGLAEMNREKRRFLIADLLHHSSGLPSYRPYYRRFRAEPSAEAGKELIRMILRERPEYKKGSESRYSDLGFILLGEHISQVTGCRLDRLFREKVTEPLGLEQEIFYSPLTEPTETDRARFAATEHCSWRKRIIQGEVHDEHCWLMEGVSGHAGLFSTLRGVMELTELVLRQWTGKSEKDRLNIGGTFLRKALKRRRNNSTWCLGFDTPSPGASSAGRLFSPRSIGHLGYTGTSFWIDPEEETVVVLLTNRVHPSRKNTRIREFRPWFHDSLLAGFS